MKTSRWGALRTRRERRRQLGVLVGATRFVAEEGAQERFSLDLLDLDAGDAVPIRIPLTFPGHGLAMRPGRTHEAVVLEKRGRGGCAVDLVAQRVVRSIEPMPGHAFYGHCAYAWTGDEIFIAETELGSMDGAVSIRDSVRFAVLGTIPTYGVAPHDCHLIERGRTLVVTNGGGPAGSPDLPSVTFIDVKTRALLEKHEFQGGAWKPGHVAVSAGREFASVSAPRDGLPAKGSLGGVALRTRASRPMAMDAPGTVTSRLVGESLSVAIHPAARLAVATHPEADLVTFWSLDAGALATTLELPQPRGVTITLDGKFFVVSYGSDARVVFIEARHLCAVTGHRLGTGIFGGAHLYIWSH